MIGEKDTKDPYLERIRNLKPEQLNRALETFKRLLNHAIVANLQSCVHCGLCADSCHYYLISRELEAIPAYKLELVTKVFRKILTVLGGLKEKSESDSGFNSQLLERWIDSLYGRCTLCGRCALNCTMGINVTRMIRIARTILVTLDLIPPELQSTVTTTIEKGNNMGIAREDWLATLEWLSEELQLEVGDPEAQLPVDKEGTGLLYTVNPREPKFFPLSLLSTAKIFYATRENWTVSSDYYDVTNYGLYSGDDSAASLISSRLRETMIKLKSKSLIIGECGHGYNSNRWEAPEWLAVRDKFEIKSIIQVIADYIRQGRIRLDRSRIQKMVTLHDPCNLVRLGGVIEEQRYILKSAVSNFIEMVPNREKNFCCGGGGGQLSMTRYTKRRLEAGRVKADQIAKTRAQIVVAPCHNCIDQLSELNREYKLGIEVKTISEVVADALVI
ncbi:MAG: (Fe-S)-binding protein, partial [candidate division Zixibacteria bacterium]|nr:(Fe-S)-binding protein [candidate division Zixibacteria bacterium]